MPALQILIMLVALSVTQWACAHDNRCALAPADRPRVDVATAIATAGLSGRIFGRAGEVDGFDNEVEAAAAAASLFNPPSIREDREYLGGILYDGSGYYYTVSPGHPGGDQVTAHIPVPRGQTLVAFWHTHGSAAPERRFFSEVDTHLVRSFDKPLYLADYTGTLKVYAPGDRTLSPALAYRLGLPFCDGYAAGTVVMDAAGGKTEVATRTDNGWISGMGLTATVGRSP